MTISAACKFKAKVFKALGHPSRLLIVEALGQGERCVCELQEILNEKMPNVSKHLAVLREAGVVQDERRGASVYYSLKMTCVSSFMICIEKVMGEHLEEQIKVLGSMKKAG